MNLTDDIVQFFERQNFVIVSTVERDGSLNNSCKGIVEISKGGRVYLLDLYKKRTFKNLRQNPNISITAVDEHKFKGYCLKGKARITRPDELKPHVLKAWEEKITSRITQRVLKNIRGEKGHPRHPEANLPKPEYVIVMEVKDVIDLTPHHLK